MAAYLCIFPFLCITFLFFNHTLLARTISVYHYCMIVLTGLLIIADFEIYSVWGYRLDSSIFKYIHHPQEVIASSLSSPLFLIFFLGILLVTTGIYLFRTMVVRHYLPANSKYYYLPIDLFITIALIIPIRGGFQLAPVNESTVYFSDNPFANQSAINCIWSFSHSILEHTYSTQNPYEYYAEERCNEIIANIQKQRIAPHINILKDSTSQPNIIFIVWESGTAKAQIAIDNKTIVPNLEQLKKEGIYFENCYGSGNRTDKGLIAILCGYPAQPTTSIIMNPTKSIQLPSLGEDLNKVGYASTFIYGGELEFANIKTFLVSKGFNQLIDKNNFEKSQCNSKWGAHDEYTFDKLLDKSSQTTQPFFNVLLTLSSHEPFEIPIKPLLKPDSRDHLFYNSLHYTDSCLGDFIAKAKLKPWWNNTLIVIVADHGSYYPIVNDVHNLPPDFKIPLLIVGGALNRKNMLINHTVSQTDIPNIILNQLHLKDSAYIFGNDVIGKPPFPFAYYTFNEGFGVMTDNGGYVYDLVGKIPLPYEGNKESLKEKGKAYLQYSFRDYLLK